MARAFRVDPQLTHLSVHWHPHSALFFTPPQEHAQRNARGTCSVHCQYRAGLRWVARPGNCACEGCSCGASRASAQEGEPWSRIAKFSLAWTWRRRAMRWQWPRAAGKGRCVSLARSARIRRVCAGSSRGWRSGTGQRCTSATRPARLATAFIASSPGWVTRARSWRRRLSRNGRATG